jgi:hypothetical protein
MYQKEVTMIKRNKKFKPFKLGGRKSHQKGFSKPRYGLGFVIRYYALSEIEILRRRVTYIQTTAFVLALATLITWHVYIVFNRSLGEVVNLTRLGLLIWFLAVALVVWASLIVPENKRRFLIWLGFLPPIDKKENVALPDQQKMRYVTRWISYAFLAYTLAMLIWWHTDFLIEGTWIGQSIRLMVTVLLMLGCVMHLERIWFFRRTRLPLLMAFFTSVLLAVVIYDWIKSFDYWIW